MEEQDKSHLFSKVSLTKRGNTQITKYLVKGVTWKQGFTNLFRTSNPIKPSSEFEMVRVTTQ